MSSRPRSAVSAAAGLAWTGVGSARRSAVVLLALFSFVWLNSVAETHHHQPVASFTTAVSTEGTSQTSSNPSSPDQPSDCPICDEISHSSAYLLPTLFAFVVAALASIWIAPSVAAILAVRTRSHAWLSRAPPLPIQA